MVKSNNQDANGGKGGINEESPRGTPQENQQNPELLITAIDKQIEEQLKDKESPLTKAINKQVNQKLITETLKIERSSTEKVGIISTIIGLGIAFVSVSASQKDAFTTTITLILTVCAFTTFATLIHLYFNDEKFSLKALDILKWALIIAVLMLLLAIIGQRRLLYLFSI